MSQSPPTHLVELEAYGAGIVLLCVVNGGLQCQPLGAEPEPIVYQLSVPAERMDDMSIIVSLRHHYQRSSESMVHTWA